VLPSPLPALRWRGEGEAYGGSVKMRPKRAQGWIKEKVAKSDFAKKRILL
jgi:hypothetical protein